MSLFKASEFCDAVDSHRFCLFLFDSITNTCNQDSELINEFTTQHRGYGEALNIIEPNESQQRVVSIHHTLTETANVEYENPFR